MEWLAVFSALLAIYVSLVTRQIKTDLTEAWMFQIQIAPIIAVGLFGVSKTQNQYLFYDRIGNTIELTIFFASVDLLSVHCFVSNVYIQRLSRCVRRNSTTNKGSKRRFSVQRTEIMNGGGMT